MKGKIRKKEITVIHRAVLFSALFCFIAFGYAVPSFALQSTVVDAVGKASVGNGITHDEARRLALERARRAAIEETAGMENADRPKIYKAAQIDEMILKRTGGRITGQDILLNECVNDKGETVCTVMIRASIGLSEHREDAPFRINASVGRADADTDSDMFLFHEGDEIVIRTELDRKGYLYLFEVNQKGDVSRLFPVKDDRASLVGSDKKFLFPDRGFRGKGNKLMAESYRDHRKSDWSIVVIAATDYFPILEEAGDSPDISDLVTELVALDKDAWTHVTLSYIVLK